MSSTTSGAVMRVAGQSLSTLRIVNDSGFDDSDGTTNEVPVVDTDPPLGANAVFEYRLSGAAAATDAWVSDLPDLVVADGPYTVTVRVVEDGVASAETQSIAFVFDTTVAVLSATLINGDAGGAVAGIPAFAFDNLEAGAVVEFSTDNGENWRDQEALSLLNGGSYALVFRQIDVAGNVSDGSQAVAVSIGAGAAPPTQPSQPDASYERYSHDGRDGLSGSDFSFF